MLIFMIRFPTEQCVPMALSIDSSNAENDIAIILRLVDIFEHFTT